MKNYVFFGLSILVSLSIGFSADSNVNPDWPVLKQYDSDHLFRIALPLGGIGTGTVSLGGRGDLRDWEIMNRPAKGYVPAERLKNQGPFFAIFIAKQTGETFTRALEGPVEYPYYEDYFGSSAPNHGLPRFRECSFATAYPLGQVLLADADLPVDVRIEAFNPLLPTDPDKSGLPVAILRYVVQNKTSQPLEVSICGNLPNFIGMDGWEQIRGWNGEYQVLGAKNNRNSYRMSEGLQGVFMSSDSVSKTSSSWGTMALITTAKEQVSYRKTWTNKRWGDPLLDFWDDFSNDGILEPRDEKNVDRPMASLAVKTEIPANSKKSVLFMLAWHFPNRYTWTPKETDTKACENKNCCDPNLIGNYYTTQFSDAWQVAEKVVPQLPDLEKQTVSFVSTFCKSDLPEAVKEAALFNISTLRTQTCFRLPDGHFFGWEGCCSQKGCCHGSCTHVWNYEQATAFLFGDLALTMRDVEFNHALDDRGMMSFRVNLPLSRANDYQLAAADGQMGCIMKMYRDWQLSGNDEFLRKSWPNVKKTLAFCWLPGGWDANQDGVMEGCQHNTMDVEYYGPNPQMGLWYLGALRAAEQMAGYMEDQSFAEKCRKLFRSGSQWIDANLFNGEYYEHQIEPPKDESKILKGLRHHMGAENVFTPDYQLGAGCLVDQLVGQFMGHVCGLGYLVSKDNVRQTLASIMKYNYRKGLYDHFNALRTYALGDEAALLMASYPNERPQYPFPYFTEVMTGFEYTAAIGMLYENQLTDGLKCIENIRDRYDGVKRNPFDEAECGHHYARAMASWASVLALTGFQYSGVEQKMTFAARPGAYFWSNGYAWGQCVLEKAGEKVNVQLTVLGGNLELARFDLDGYGEKQLEMPMVLKGGLSIEFDVEQSH